ncbi:hypothetical protein [Vibrio splendidus]|uniref:hypothetical protein n=1 Tax=Vibrio splendidus TaxID=29497 RepID=UPI00021C1205|nr:hypothetical protein [Vibrio splendidus]EGU43289.1 hypothetical protein VISP3789_06280 [Vibrio splendidus ATCC 33789]
MSDFTAIGQLVNEARNLLDSIKGGAIRVMQTQFDALIKAKKVTLDKFVSDQYGRVSSVLNDVHGELPHVLLTRNQRMETVNTKSIRGFKTIYCQEFEVIKEATVHGSSGVDHTGNGVLEEFRASVIGNKTYVNGYFDIVRIKFKRSADATHPSRLNNFWNNGNHQGAMTGAALVKVIKGNVGGWPVQISHANGWETRGSQARAETRSANLHSGLGHSCITLGSNSIPNDEGEILICLFGVANGVVDFDRWGLWPELDKSWRV